MRSVQGSHASYNGQSVVDDKNGLIVHADVVKDTSDLNQLAQQITPAESVLEKQCQVAGADAGFLNNRNVNSICFNSFTLFLCRRANAHPRPQLITTQPRWGEGTEKWEFLYYQVMPTQD